MKKRTKQNILLLTGITATLAGAYLVGKGEKINEVFANLFIKKENEIDYNNPDVHAPIDYYLENTDGIATNSDGTIKVGVWSAVKEGLKNIFRG